MYQNGSPFPAVDPGVGHTEKVGSGVAGGVEPEEYVEESPIAASYQQNTMIKLMVRHDIAHAKYDGCICYKERVKS